MRSMAAKLPMAARLPVAARLPMAARLVLYRQGGRMVALIVLMASLLGRPN
jgi:hypothetical protein